MCFGNKKRCNYNQQYSNRVIQTQQKGLSINSSSAINPLRKPGQCVLLVTVVCLFVCLPSPQFLRRNIQGTGSWVTASICSNSEFLGLQETHSNQMYVGMTGLRKAQLDTDNRSDCKGYRQNVSGSTSPLKSEYTHMIKSNP